MGSLSGIESIVLENRTRDEVETTVRAGLLEQGTVDLLRETGVGARLDREAFFHRGIYLRFLGSTHHIDMKALTGRGVALYPQQEVVKDLIKARLDAGGEIVFSVSGVEVRDPLGDRPSLSPSWGSSRRRLVASASLATRSARKRPLIAWRSRAPVPAAPPAPSGAPRDDPRARRRGGSRDRR